MGIPTAIGWTHLLADRPRLPEVVSTNVFRSDLARNLFQSRRMSRFLLIIIDEERKIGCYVLEGFVGHQIHRLDPSGSS